MDSDIDVPRGHVSNMWWPLSTGIFDNLRTEIIILTSGFTVTYCTFIHVFSHDDGRYIPV